MELKGPTFQHLQEIEKRMAAQDEAFFQAHPEFAPLRGTFVAATVEKVANWARKNSLWPLLFGTACCAIEMMATYASRYDLGRFGAEVYRASPRQSDLLIVAGRVSVKMGPVLKQLYEQMPNPKWVISMGACASCGGVFNNYALIQGIDKIIPVDIYVPGCPPRPEALIESIMILQKGIQEGRFNKV